MLIQCRDLFMKRPDILKKWQEKFQYILVDEFQDVNQAQYDVVRMLAAPQDNLFVVGMMISQCMDSEGQSGNHEGIYEGLSKGQTDPSGCQLSQQRIYCKRGSAYDRK